MTTIDPKIDQLIDELVAKIGVALEIGKRIEENSFRMDADNPDEESIIVCAGHVAHDMLINPVSIWTLLEEYNDEFEPAFSRAAWSIAKIAMADLEDDRLYRDRCDGYIYEWLNANTDIKRDGLRFPENW